MIIKLKKIQKIFVKPGKLPFFLAVLLLILFYLMLRFFPDPQLNTFLNKDYSKKIYDRNGKLLYYCKTLDNHYRSPCQLDKIPSFTKQAFIQSEDRHFYYHPGFDILALIRGSWQLMQSGRIISGGSTITMQLSSLIISRPRTIFAKMQEILHAFYLEIRLSKSEILSLYLDNLPFAFECQGIEAACWQFFEKEARALSKTESLLLAIIPRQPDKYNPYKNPENILPLLRRYNQILNWKITEKQFKTMFYSLKRKNKPFLAPHFVRWLIDDQYIKNQKEETIHSSLDISLNRNFQFRLKQMLQQHREDRLENGALLLLDHKSGEIISWVGSPDYYDDAASGQIDGVLVKSQPGSCLKPFLYAMAFEEGFLPSDILPDIPTELGYSEVYIPINYDRRYRGPVRMRTALASSLNIPATLLINELGASRFADFLINLDFNSLREQKDQLGAGLALGNAEVQLLELARAFCIFNRDGFPLKLSYKKGGISINKYPKSAHRISQFNARLIRDILSDPEARDPGFGAFSYNIDFDLMLKTGTANQFQHIWALAASPDYTAAVWMGNFSGETVIGKPGSSLPARLCVEMLREVQKEGAKFSLPEKADLRPICALSGKSPGPHCPSITYEWFPKERSPEKCSFHKAGKNRQSRLTLPPEYREWLDLYGKEADISLSRAFRIIKPRSGAVYYLDNSIPLSDQKLRFYFAKSNQKEIEIRINGQFQAKIPPDKSQWDFQLQKGDFKIIASCAGEQDTVFLKVK